VYRATSEGAALVRGYRALRRELLVALAGLGREVDLPDLDRRLVQPRRPLRWRCAGAAVQRQLGAAGTATIDGRPPY
jgi:hypothetical protein